MKVEFIDGGYNVFVHTFYFDSVNWDDKVDIENTIRDVLTRICDNYNISLSGFYRIKIFPHEMGVFMEIFQIDEESYDGCEIDFRIVVIFNKEMYLKFDDNDYFKEYDKVYIDGYYYINLDSFDNFLSILDFGEITTLSVFDLGRSLPIKGIKK